MAWLPFIPPAIRDKIVEFEVSTRSWYEKFAARPTWPGGASGITIGIGYDLGQHSAAEFRRDWEGTEAGKSLDLAACCGVCGTQASWLMHTVSFMQVSYEDAVRVFDNVILPRYIDLTVKTFPNCDLLPMDAFGALVDLVYNRGTSMTGDSRREMAAIKNAMAAGDFVAIPAYIRAMKRLWPLSTGLQARREWEAATFAEAISKSHPVQGELNYGTSDPLGR